MVSVNGAELYHEVRGSGPPVLLIMGATGDGGHFDTLADLLADEFTLITYDRCRPGGRCALPPPIGRTHDGGCRRVLSASEARPFD